MAMGGWQMVVVATLLSLNCVGTVAGRCSVFEKRCPGNVCVQSGEKCPNVDCGLFERKCPDGSCVVTSDSCPNDCGDNEKKCPDGKCVPDSLECLDPVCVGSENICDNEFKCFTEDQRCDNFMDCAEGTDEEDCGGQLFNISKWPWWIVALIAGVIVLLSLIVALWCRCASKQNRARRLRRAQRAGRQTPDSHEMPVVAGRRTQPVRGRATDGAQYGALPTTPPQGPQPPSNTPTSQTRPPPTAYPTPQPFAPHSPGGFPSTHVGTPPVHDASSGGVQPSAPPLVMDVGLAPPPYYEIDPQQGVHGRDYLPSYDTAQRSSPAGPSVP